MGDPSPSVPPGGAVVVAAAAVPAAYQLFRMAYYAMWVPSTALAKAAGILVVVAGCHLPVELRRPVHALAPPVPWPR